MPITQINGVSPRPQREDDDPLSTIFKGLQIANQVFEIPTNIAAMKKAQAEAEAANKRLATGGYDKLDLHKAGVEVDESGNFRPSAAAVQKEQTERVKTAVDDLNRSYTVLNTIQSAGKKPPPGLLEMINRQQSAVNSIMGGSQQGGAGGATQVSFGGQNLGGGFSGLETDPNWVSPDERAIRRFGLQEQIKEQKAKSERARQNKIQGLEHDSTFEPQRNKVEDYRTLRESTAPDLKRMIGEMREMIKTSGSEWLPTEKKALMASKMAQIQLKMKEFANLGVLNGPDMEIMLRQMGDPTAVNFQNAFGGNATLKTLDDIEKGIDFGVEQTGRGLGYKMPKAKPQQQASDPATQEKINKAKALGYSDAEIEAYLNGQKTKP